jgi:hypothetical protein
MIFPRNPISRQTTTAVFTYMQAISPLNFCQALIKGPIWPAAWDLSFRKGTYLLLNLQPQPIVWWLDPTRLRKVVFTREYGPVILKRCETAEGSFLRPPMKIKWPDKVSQLASHNLCSPWSAKALLISVLSIYGYSRRLTQMRSFELSYYARFQGNVCQSTIIRCQQRWTPLLSLDTSWLFISTNCLRLPTVFHVSWFSQKTNFSGPETSKSGSSNYRVWSYDSFQLRSDTRKCLIMPSLLEWSSRPLR